MSYKSIVIEGKIKQEGSQVVFDSIYAIHTIDPFDLEAVENLRHDMIERNNKHVVVKSEIFGAITYSTPTRSCNNSVTIEIASHEIHSLQVARNRLEDSMSKAKNNDRLQYILANKLVSRVQKALVEQKGFSESEVYKTVVESKYEILFYVETFNHEQHDMETTFHMVPSDGSPLAGRVDLNTLSKAHSYGFCVVDVKKGNKFEVKQKFGLHIEAEEYLHQLKKEV